MPDTKTPKTDKERKAAERERYRKMGFVTSRPHWVRPEWHDKIKDYIDSLRDGKDMKLAEITAYELPGNVRIERCKLRDGSYKWAVRREDECLNTNGEFEYEPVPSERDNDFLARCRYDSAENAYTAWESHLAYTNLK